MLHKHVILYILHMSEQDGRLTPTGLFSKTKHSETEPKHMKHRAYVILTTLMYTLGDDYFLPKDPPSSSNRFSLLPTDFILKLKR